MNPGMRTRLLQNAADNSETGIRGDNPVGILFVQGDQHGLRMQVAVMIHIFFLYVFLGVLLLIHLDEALPVAHKDADFSRVEARGFLHPDDLPVMVDGFHRIARDARPEACHRAR